MAGSYHGQVHEENLKRLEEFIRYQRKTDTESAKWLKK